VEKHVPSELLERLDALASRWHMRTCLYLCIGLLLVCSSARAQDATGRIVGTVTDPSGAVIPGAEIVVTNPNTGVSRKAVTEADGNFQVLQVPIGIYRVSAERPGFQTVVTGAQPLQINQSLRFDIPMEIGAATQTVQVEATPASVETINPTLGQSVTSRPLHDLPLNGRNMLDLTLLQPGVTEQRPDGGPAPSTVPGAFRFSAC
jgi:hypothetical protein